MLSFLMKRSCAVALILTLSATLSYGQDYDLKKDVILFNKVPYAKYSGKVGMLKGANFMVSSLNGDSLIAIKTWNYPSGNPMFSFLDGYEIRFVRSGEKVIKPCLSTLTKEQLVNFIFNGRNYEGKWEDTFKQKLIVDNNVDAAAEAAFIEKFDNAKAVEWAKDYELRERERLVDIFPIRRDATLPIKFKNVTNSRPGSHETIEVYQGDVRLAIIIKENKSVGMTKYVYTFQYPLKEHEIFKVGDKEIDTIVIATATVDSFPKIFINVEAKSKSIDIANPASAERQIMEYLVTRHL